LPIRLPLFSARHLSNGTLLRPKIVVWSQSDSFGSLFLGTSLLGQPGGGRSRLFLLIYTFTPCRGEAILTCLLQMRRRPCDISFVLESFPFLLLFLESSTVLGDSRRCVLLPPPGGIETPAHQFAYPPICNPQEASHRCDTPTMVGNLRLGHGAVRDSPSTPWCCDSARPPCHKCRPELL